MEFLYAVRDGSELPALQAFAGERQHEIEAFIDYLKNFFAVRDLPRAIVLTSGEIASGLLADIPVPAYTNDCRIVFAPELETWRGIYLKQLRGFADGRADAVRRYYESELSERHLLQILGHELAHHSEWFSDEAYAHGGAWFEEGMVEYISRKYFLTQAEFDREAEINRVLTALYEETHPQRPLSSFGVLPERGDFATLYYDYWRAFLRVSEQIDAHGGDAAAVLRAYGQSGGNGQCSKE